MPYTDGEAGNVVAGGKHVVPDGVAVEELDGGKKKLLEMCPPDVEKLLASKNLMETYNKMVQAIADESNTRTVFGKWKDAEFDSVLDLFRDDFAQQNVKIALCKRSSNSSTKRWLEFIDVDQVPDYVPQYDVANTSGQIIKTVYATLEFPSGVAVEELKQWNGRKALKEKIPIYVEKLLTKKDLMNEYHALVDSCVENGVGRRFKNWNVKKLQQLIEEHRPLFEAKGVALFISIKQEYVNHGQYGGHTEDFRWIEFVDREEQPNYHPQRDATTRNECTIQ